MFAGMRSRSGDTLMKKLVLSLLAFCVMGSSLVSGARADDLCGDKARTVQWVQVVYNGDLQVRFDGDDSVTLCNVGASKQGVTPEACQAAHSMLMAAKLSGRPASLRAENCDAKPLNKAYVGLN